MSSFVDISNLYANQYKTVIKFTHVWFEKVVSFKAFLTEYNDEYKTEWNSEQVYGRNDPIQTFKSTTRVISLGWDVPAASFEESAENMSRAALLVKFLYPTYDGPTQAAQTISRPPLVRVSFQNLIQGIGEEGLLCTMGGISFSPDLDAGWFDVGEGISTPNSSKSPLLYPKLINFNCQLTIMHESSIGWDTNSKFGISEKLENFPFLNNENKIDENRLGSTFPVQALNGAAQEQVAAATAHFQEQTDLIAKKIADQNTAAAALGNILPPGIVGGSVEDKDFLARNGSDETKIVDIQNKSTNPGESDDPQLDKLTRGLHASGYGWKPESN